jgi:hypothetical protein
MQPRCQGLRNSLLPDGRRFSQNLAQNNRSHAVGINNKENVFAAANQITSATMATSHKVFVFTRRSKLEARMERRIWLNPVSTLASQDIRSQNQWNRCSDLTETLPYPGFHVSEAQSILKEWPFH